MTFLIQFKFHRTCCHFLIPSVIMLFYVILLMGWPQGAESSRIRFSEEERIKLRDESRSMFFHAYNSYLKVAFPADELMPLSCKGRFRGIEKNRGDIDDAMGNFSLTLIDSLDTLVVFGDMEEFEHGVKLVIDHVHFDHDIIVSVFETNIRVVGGLISAHVLSEYARDRLSLMKWYKGELLNMAVDIGYRLLPAFNSTTGLPHPRVNLKYGIKQGKIKYVGETCTACAGTMILEFAALSRLSGEPIFEEKASHAMDVLWASRHRQSNLVGNVLNINTGDWVRKDSGIGAGIDSYYEYVAKAYVLLGEEKYLGRWETHYQAVMKYLGQQPLFQDVHMHKPQTNSKHFVDSLGAFWPGLQVLMGDIKPAIESHEIMYQVMKRHNFIPEAFTTEYQVHWGQHLLRPEFVESTYFLYRATHDDYYLEVGKKLIEAIQLHAKVPCGYATIKDVRTLQQEDRMDSFVLAETFKYLYLLFAKEDELILNINDFVFTTEAHLLPLYLARMSNKTAVPLPKNYKEDLDVDISQSCPSTDFLFPHYDPSDDLTHHFAHHIRSPLANTVTNKCPIRKVLKRKLYATEFQNTNQKHMDMIKSMGISIVSLPDGRIQLMHTLANADTPDDGEEGLLFMSEMIELSKQTSTAPETPPKIISYVGKDPKTSRDTLISLFAGPAQFGKMFDKGFELTGELVRADPLTGCLSITNGDKFWNKIVVVERGDCMFVEKARNLESLGAKGGIVLDNVPGSSSKESPLFAMSGDGTDDVSIPMLFLFNQESKILGQAMEDNPKLMVTMMEATEEANDDKSTENGDEPGSSPFSNFDFTAPVKSFLEQSRRQVEKYFGGGENRRDPNVEVVPDYDDEFEIEIVSESDSEAVISQIKGSDKTVVGMQHFTEESDGSIKVRKLTDEEVADILIKQARDKDLDTIEKQAKQEENERAEILPQVLTGQTDGKFVNIDKYKHILSELSEHRPKIRKMLETYFLSEKKNSQRLSQVKTLDLVRLFVQSIWENVDSELDNSLELVMILVTELESVESRIDRQISEYVLRSVDVVYSKYPEILNQFRNEVINEINTSVPKSGDVTKFLESMNEKLETFVNSKTSGLNQESGEREEMISNLYIFPVLYEIFENIKSGISVTLTKHNDEL